MVPSCPRREDNFYYRRCPHRRQIQGVAVDVTLPMDMVVVIKMMTILVMQMESAAVMSVGVEMVVVAVISVAKLQKPRR